MFKINLKYGHKFRIQDIEVRNNLKENILQKN